MSDQSTGGTRNAFGMEAEGTPEPDFLADYVDDAPEPVDAPAAEPQQQPEIQPQDEGTPSAEPQEPTQAVPEAPIAGADHRLPPELIEQLGGRFADKSLADVIAAWNNQEAWATRVSQERSDYQRELESLKQRYDAERQQVAPFLQWANAMIESGELDPQDLARFVGPQQAPTQEAGPDPYVAAQQQHAIQTFAQAHPEAVNDPSMDAAMTRIIKTFRYDPETGQEDESEFALTAENLEIAYTLAREPSVERLAHDLQFIPSDNDDLQLLRDAASDPGLYQQLKANPQYLETTEGHLLARRQSQILSGYSQAEQRAPAVASAQTEEMKRRAHVERGGSGVPTQAAPGKVAPEDMDAAQLWDAVMDRAKTSRSNVFGL